MSVTVSGDLKYYYIMHGESDAECYVQRKRQELATDNPIDHKMPESTIIGLCEKVEQLEKENAHLLSSREDWISRYEKQQAIIQELAKKLDMAGDEIEGLCGYNDVTVKLKALAAQYLEEGK